MNFNFLGFFRKNEYFLVYEDFMDYLGGGGGGGGGLNKIELYTGVISMHLRVFS